MKARLFTFSGLPYSMAVVFVEFQDGTTVNFSVTHEELICIFHNSAIGEKLQSNQYKLYFHSLMSIKHDMKAPHGLRGNCLMIFQKWASMPEAKE